MILGILDFEATGVNPQSAFPTEIAILFHDTSLKQSVRVYSSLINPDPDEEILSDEAASITGISIKMLNQYGKSIYDVLSDTIYLFNYFCIDYLVAHNALSYDKIIWDRMIDKVYGDFGRDMILGKVKWIDTMRDCPLPDTIRSRSLMNICAHYRYFIQDPHRALNDCLATEYLIKQFHIEDLIANAEEKLVTLSADLVKPWEDADLFSIQRDAIKKHRFFWKPETKQWLVEAKERAAEKIMEDLELKNISTKIINE